jgi:uncharacterized membrane protein (DUF4010 family)
VETTVTALVVSASLGALVGLIRQWSDQAARPAAEADLGGVRTYALLALLGWVGAYVGGRYAPAVLPVVLAAVALHLTAMQLRGAAAGSHPGTTTLVSSLLTCLVGALVAWGHTNYAVLVTAVTAVTVGLKQPIHAWTRTLTPEDIRATLQFIAITGVILPLVPNRDFGPLGAFNPYSIWLLVVLISGIGFAGYLMMRFLGTEAGITLTGIAGGLASSTSTTLAFSRRSREEPALSGDFALAVILACTVMLPRVLVIMGVVHQELALRLVPAFAAMAVPGLLFAVWHWLARRRAGATVATPRLTNPLALGMAVKFALIYGLVVFLVKAATHLDWQGGLLPLSFVSGLTDLDAIALSMADGRNDGSVGPVLALQAVLVAAVANTLMKAGLALALGHADLRRPVAAVLGLTVLVGVGALAWTFR